MNALDRFKHWDSVREGLNRALDSLSDDQLKFRPNDNLWSIAETVCHIAEAEEGWFRHYMVGRSGSAPVFDPADYPSVPGLKQLLHDVHAETREFLRETDDEGLDSVVAFSWGSEAPISWVIWHVLEHEIHHRGEIYLMLGLLGLEAPDV